MLKQQGVILLHGIGRTRFSMLFLEFKLKRLGFYVVNKTYPSRQLPIEQLSEFIDHAINQCKKHNATPIHFVTHSLGSILVRHYFQSHPTQNIGRVVMLGPPNHGSEIASLLKDTYWFKKVWGAAGQQLGVEHDSVPNMLKPIDLEVGIIAGNNNGYTILSSLVAKPNDGLVSLDSAKLSEMNDFCELPVSHGVMLFHSLVSKQVVSFINHGRFDK